jgi:prepilin-type N-terminal cleavage/methylation domain-containing protein
VTRALRQRLRVGGDAGFTLIEMVVTMAILATVVGGISQIFASSVKSQADLKRRYTAQEELLTGMNRLKRDVNAACYIDGTNTAEQLGLGTITLDYGTNCASQVTWCVSSSSLYRTQTASCPTGGAVWVHSVTTATPFSYYPCNDPANSYTIPRVAVDLRSSPVSGSTVDSFHYTDTFVVRNGQRQANPTC